jgi:hypothetical protein
MLSRQQTQKEINQMKHRDKINEMVTEVIHYYFERGYTGWRSIEDLIDELDAEERGR